MNGLKKYNEARAFSPHTRMITGPGRPFSGADTALKKCADRSGYSRQAIKFKLKQNTSVLRGNHDLQFCCSRLAVSSKDYEKLIELKMR